MKTSRQWIGYLAVSALALSVFSGCSTPTPPAPYVSDAGSSNPNDPYATNGPNGSPSQGSGNYGNGSTNSGNGNNNSSSGSSGSGSTTKTDAGAPKDGGSTALATATNPEGVDTEFLDTTGATAAPVAPTPTPVDAGTTGP